MLLNIYFLNLKEFKNRRTGFKTPKNMTNSQDFHFVFFTPTEYNTSFVKPIRHLDAVFAFRSDTLSLIVKLLIYTLWKILVGINNSWKQELNSLTYLSLLYQAHEDRNNRAL